MSIVIKGRFISLAASIGNPDYLRSHLSEFDIALQLLKKNLCQSQRFCDLFEDFQEKTRMSNVQCPMSNSERA